MTPGDAARTLGVSTATLSNWANAGRITAVVLPSGHRRYPVTEVRRLAAERTPPDAA